MLHVEIFQSGANTQVRRILMRLFGACALVTIAEGVNLGLYFGGREIVRLTSYASITDP
jgi:hypothetical protein